MSGTYDIDGVELYYMPYKTPEDYGAVGDGDNNDTSAIQQAVNNSGLVLFSTGKTYKTGTIRLKENTIVDLNGASITCTSGHLFFNFISGATSSGYDGNGNITIKNGTIIGGGISFAHGENITLQNIIFANSKNDHFLEICACKNYTIRNCSFIGMEYLTTSVMEYINIDPCFLTPFPWNQNIPSFYDGTVNDGITIDSCYFSIGTGDYANGYNAIGVHSSDGQKHQKVKITNNEISGFTGCGLRINNMDDVLITGNSIKLTASGTNGIRVGDVSQSTNVLIKNNAITASGTAITKANSSTVFQSTDNDINPTFS